MPKTDSLLTSIFLPVIPFLWLLSHNVIYLVLVQIFAGFFWAGFNLSVSNFIFDAVSPEKRTRCIAYFNVVNGTALFSGALIGGFLMKWLPALLGYKILALALISGLLRIGSALLAGRVREVRSVREVSARDLFYSVIGVRPLP